MISSYQVSSTLETRTSKPYVPDILESTDSKCTVPMESASNQAATSAKRHYLVALAVSFALSMFFWIALDVFNFVGFVFWTCIAALLGSSIGLVADRKLLITVISTAVIRTLIFVAMTWFVL